MAISFNDQVTVDLKRNAKQFHYFTKVVATVNGLYDYRKFCYGGAIRGGKTYVTLFILLWLCDRFPGSVWVVMRDDFPNLLKTTIPSLRKMLIGSKRWHWNQDKSNYYVINDKGSKILFMAENITRDPELNSLLGLECNGFFLEQLEEFSRRTWDIAQSRAGSLYLPDQPPAFMFTTFNPTQNWPKEFIYNRHVKGILPPDFFYQTALPDDNAFVTQDQWNAWGSMDSRYQSQFIKGDWTDFDDDDPRWAYTYSPIKHERETLPFYPTYPIYTAWDFNREPMTCTVIQRSESIGGKHDFVHFLKEYKLNAQIHEICARINSDYPGSLKYVCGDVSGKKGDVGYIERNMTHYKLIAQCFDIQNFDGFVHLNSKNLEHGDSRLLVNTMLNIHPNVHFSVEGCPNLTAEYRKAKVNVKHAKPGHLLKDRVNNQLDLFDGSRYFWQTYYLDHLNTLLMMQGQQIINGNYED